MFEAIKQVKVDERLPDEGDIILLYSTDEQWFIGTYRGAGQFFVVTTCTLQADGSLKQFGNTIFKSYFQYWSLLERGPNGK